MGPSVSFTRKAPISRKIRVCNIPAFDTLFTQLEKHQLAVLEANQVTTGNWARLGRMLGFPRNLKQITTETMLNVLMFHYAYFSGGRLADIGFNVTSSLPFFHLNKEEMRPDILEVYQAWEELINQIQQIALHIKDLLPQISESLSEINSTIYSDVTDKAEDALKEANLGLFEASKSVAIVTKNLEIVSCIPKVLISTNETAGNIIRECVAFCESNELPRKIAYAEEVGKQALASGVTCRKRRLKRFYLARTEQWRCIDSI